MRVLLQNSVTKLYFIEKGQWTDDPSKATDFREVKRAEQMYHTHDLAYAQIVVDPGPLERREVVGELLNYAQAHR
jgi:hypothetical protein